VKETQEDEVRVYCFSGCHDADAISADKRCRKERQIHLICDNKKVTSALRGRKTGRHLKFAKTEMIPLRLGETGLKRLVYVRRGRS